MTEKVRLARTEEQVLEHVKSTKKVRDPVWLSEIVEALRIEPREVVRSAKRLEALGLMKPKTTA